MHKHKSSPAAEWMTVTVVACHLDLSEDHIRSLIQMKVLQAVDISVGARPAYRVSTEAVDRFASARKVA